MDTSLAWLELSRKDNPRIIAALKVAINEKIEATSCKQNVHALSTTLHTSFNSAVNWTVDI